MIKQLFIILYIAIGFYNNSNIDNIIKEQLILPHNYQSSIIYCKFDNIKRKTMYLDSMLNILDSIDYKVILDVPRLTNYQNFFNANNDKNYTIKNDTILIGKYIYSGNHYDTITISTKQYYNKNKNSIFPVINIIFKYKNKLKIKINYSTAYYDSFIIFSFNDSLENFSFNNLYKNNKVHSQIQPKKNKWNIFQFNIAKFDTLFKNVKSINFIGKQFSISQISGRLEKEDYIQNTLKFIKQLSIHKSIIGWYLIDELPTQSKKMGLLYYKNPLLKTPIKEDETIEYIIYAIADSIKKSYSQKPYVLISPEKIRKKKEYYYVFNNYKKTDIEYIFDCYPITKNTFNKDFYLNVLKNIRKEHSDFSFVIQGFSDHYYGMPKYKDIKILFFLPIIMGAENIFIYRYYSYNQKSHKNILLHYKQFFQEYKNIIDDINSSCGYQYFEKGNLYAGIFDLKEKFLIIIYNNNNFESTFLNFQIKPKNIRIIYMGK